MTRKSLLPVKILVGAVCICSAFTAQAQETTIEFWPEIDAWYRISPAWRFSMYLPLSKNIETKYREGNITYQYDSRSSVTHLYALNIILHVYFETKRARA